MFNKNLITDGLMSNKIYYLVKTLFKKFVLIHLEHIYLPLKFPQNVIK